MLVREIAAGDLQDVGRVDGGSLRGLGAFWCLAFSGVPEMQCSEDDEAEFPSHDTVHKSSASKTTSRTVI